MRRRILGVVGVAACVLFGLEGDARADAVAPGLRPPRDRLCCALATHMPLHLGASHVPISLGQIGSVAVLGRHSYTGWARGEEGNGLVYTRNGGFLDMGHTRDYADLTAYYYVRLKPLLAKGSGAIEIHPLLATRKIVVDKAVPPERLDETAVIVARKAAFEMSIWTEVVQFYGRGKMRGAEEVYSAFTPDDLYSNLFGTMLGAQAVTSDQPYDDAMTALLKANLERLGAVSSAEGERTLYGLVPEWWHRDEPWPSAEIAVKRAFGIGPVVSPVLAEPGTPAGLEVPDHDRTGEPLADYFHAEFVPEPESLPFFAQHGVTTVTSADLPKIVAEAHATNDRLDGHVAQQLPPESGTPLTHFQNGIRLVELGGSGGLQATTEPNHARGTGGGELTAVLGDTRGGDFHTLRLGVGNTDKRGVVASAAVFQADVVYFCHDPETGKLRAPLVSLLGPCAPGEILGFGGSVGEALHDGKTGRTALRPISAYGVINVLGNGQSRSYDRRRVLLRAGGALEHFWSVQDHADFVPRIGANAIAMARSAGGSFEARGITAYRIDPANTDDAAIESAASLRWYFLLGEKEALPGYVDGADPWGVGSLGVTTGISYWTRPLHAFPDAMAPWVAADHRVTFQALLTLTLGFEGLAF